MCYSDESATTGITREFEPCADCAFGAIAKPLEDKKFLLEMVHEDVNANRTWNIRAGVSWEIALLLILLSSLCNGYGSLKLFPRTLC